MKEFVAILHKKFGKDYKMPTCELKFCTIKLASLFDRRALAIASKWNKDLHFDNSKSKELFKLEYIPIERTLIEMTESMIDIGYIKDKRKKTK